MPIFDYECKECGEVFENIEIWTSHKAKICKKCGSKKIKKIFTSHFEVRMDSDCVKKSLPDPTPPLTELIGKGTEGFKELEKYEE